MKIFRLLIISISISTVVASCVSDSKTASIVTTAPTPPKPITGDFIGSGKVVTVKLIVPALNKDGTACIDSTCTAYIAFSDTTIKRIAVKGCIGGKPDNLGDLNGDGKDEIGLLPEWFSSCWRDYKVYTYKNGEWIYAVPPIATHCNQWEAGIKPIEKDSLNKGYVVVHYSAFEDKGIVNKSKIISIK